MTATVRIVVQEDGEGLAVGRTSGRRPARAAGALRAELVVRSAVPGRAEAIADAIEASLVRAAASMTAPEVPVVHLRTRRRIEALRPGALAGRLAIIHVRPAVERRLSELVATVLAAGPLGVQLVTTTETDRSRAAIFGVLEEARARGGHGPPIRLARTDVPVLALRLALSTVDPVMSKKGEPSC